VSRIYLLSSLPALVLGQDSLLSLEAFQGLCAILCPEEQAEAARVIKGRYQELKTDFGRAWGDLDLQIRNQIMLIRAKTWNVSQALPGPTAARYSVRARDMVSDAFELDSPLEREWALDKGRWALIQDLTRKDDPFGLDRVLAFGLQLKLVQRWAWIDKDRGREQFHSLVQTCMGKVTLDVSS